MAGDKPWPQVPVGNKDNNNAAVVIIGGGLAGMCAAIDLIKRNNCRNFIILEKSASLGGTWNDNKYPGCCCDVGSILYSYSFAPNPDWTRNYPGQEEILAYLTGVAQSYGLYQHVRFSSTVTDATWDDATRQWHVRVKRAEGTKEAESTPEYTLRTDFLVSAVGQLNTPKYPDIPGLDQDGFDGKIIHSARWDWSYDLNDKKIALLGNGCTAVQILPEIAKVAKHVTVFQRTPNWLVPRSDRPVSAVTQGVYRYVPGAMSFMRGVAMEYGELAHNALKGEAGTIARMAHQRASNHIAKSLAGHPELQEKVTPKYRVGCKRIIASDDYYPALLRPNVDLETRPIHGVCGKNIKVIDPETNEPTDSLSDYDLIVCATGFQSLDFMHPIKMYGLDHRSIHDVWEGGARALYGIAVESMPNFGMLYGPNTNLGHNSIILMLEAQSRYINGMIGEVLRAKRQNQPIRLTPKPARVAAFDEEIQAELKASAWNDPNVNSWYKTAEGRIVNNWSRNVVDYQKLVSNVRLEEDFDVVVVQQSNDSDKAGSPSTVPRVGGRKKIHVGRVHEELRPSETTLYVLGAVAGAAAIAGGFLARNPKLLEELRSSIA